MADIKTKKAIKNIEPIKSQPTSLIGLSVGGTHEITTTSNLLTQGPAKGSLLAETFSDAGLASMTKLNDKYFVDRDGKTF